jgi:outer membrane protein TolC
MSVLFRLVVTASIVMVSVPAVYAQQTPAPAAPAVRRLTIDEAVRLALDNNLGIRVARLDPQIEDLSVAVARAGWTPSFTSALEETNTDTPSTSFLSGGQSKISDKRLAGNVSVQQALPWGGNYSLGWDSSRATTTNNFSNFSPQLRSSLSVHVQQPLLRNFGIDILRQQLLVSRTNRDISDVQLRQTLATTSRTVRRAYWDLAYAIASLQVQQQSLDLAQESLRNTRSRVEIGTTPPIDIVEAESEVATRQEAVIIAEADIETSQDTLRALIYDPAMPDFWTLRIEPSELPAFEPVPVDVNAAVRNALQRRTDLEQQRKNLQSSDINLRYFRNQTLPDVTASFDYGLTGLGGTRFLRTDGFPGDIIGQTARGFGSVLGDLFGNQFPSWTLNLTIGYPIGGGSEEARLARARLEYGQSQTEIRSQELQVTSQVRNAARQVLTNQQRVQTTRVSRELAERRLDAEQKKFSAGTSTNFVVFQVQRDLAQSRNNELRAVLDYNRSIVDLETVQEAPIAGGSTTAAMAVSTAVSTGGGLATAP